MKGMSRFERKILAAIAFVGLAPLIGALVLGRSTVTDAYRTGVNPSVREQLDGAVALYQTHLETLREDAERTADAIAFHRDLDTPDPEVLRPRLDALLDRYAHVASIELSNGDVTLLRRERTERLDPETRRPITLRRTVAGREVVVVVTAPVRVFEGLQEAGEQAEFYGRMLESADFVSGTYVWVYIGLLALLILVALGLAGIVARRVTGRVTDLADAARKVGRGDLTVRVPTSGRDEVFELTEAFNAMVADLRDSRARIDYLQRIGAWQQFARRLAHEIKNPLTPIQLAAQEMVRSYEGDDAYRSKLEEAVSIIEEEVATLRRLVSEFSSFAKLPEADLAPADLGEFLLDVERSVAAIADDVFEDEPAPEVTFKTQDVPMPVRLDAMMLKRCVDNLIRNAFQAIRDAATEPDAKPPGETRLRVRATLEDGHAVLRVEDDGPGVEESHLDRLFDPYFTTKLDGTGLGLAIVKKVVLEHGGEIAYEESLWGGACFAIRLPID